MAKEKDLKTNAMRILDRMKIPYRPNFYECEEFIDAVRISDMLGQPHEIVYKTLVTEGKSRDHFVFVIPIAEELDLKKAAKAVGEKAVEMIHVKDLKDITGYIRGGCTPIGMKKRFVTVIDRSAEALPELVISGGAIGAQIFLSPADLIKATGASFSDILMEGENE